MNVIKAIFAGKHTQDSGSDSVMDYKVFDFTNIIDEKGVKFKDKWIKETQLLIKSNLIRGKEYIIKLSDSFSDNHNNLPYPIEIFDGKNKFIKRGGSIIHVDTNGEETNLSPISQLKDGEFSIACLNMFSKGKMTETYLKNKNSKGVFFYVHYFDSQEKRKNRIQSRQGFSDKKENYVLIQKETQAEIDRDLEYIKTMYITSIESYFNIITEILPSKK